jgi:hypothetical protein
MDIHVQTATEGGILMPSGAVSSDADYFTADNGAAIGVIGVMLMIDPPSMGTDALDFYQQVASYAGVTASLTITVNADLVLPLPVTIPANSSSAVLTIQGDVSGRTIKRESQDTNASGALFTVPANARVIFKDITVDGSYYESDGATVNPAFSGNVAPLVRVDGGTFTMEAGAVLRNNRATNGGGVYHNSGTFTMSGGEISGNTATGSSSANGGGVYQSGGTFTMSGGEISGNTATATTTGSASAYAYGGGVYARSTFNLNSGGKISGNTATAKATGNANATAYGGGVYAYSTFTMSNGDISGNTATAETTATSASYSANALGGGVYAIGTYNIYGGEVSGGNTVTATAAGSATANGGGVYHNGTTFRVGGTAKVKDNTRASDSSDNNAYFANGKYVTLGTAPNAPAAGIEIHVQTATEDGILMQGGAVSTDAAYFKADEPGKKVEVSIYGELQIVNE